MGVRCVSGSWQIPGTIGLDPFGHPAPHLRKGSPLPRHQIERRAKGVVASPANYSAPQDTRTHFGRVPPQSNPIPIPETLTVAWPKASPAALQIIQQGRLHPEMGFEVREDWIPKFVKVLKDEKLKRVKFQVGAIVIDSTWFDLAADALQQKLVPIILNRYSVDMEGTAEYTADIRVMTLGSEHIDGKYEKGVIVHESVHLALHRKGLLNVLKTENEVVAHLAQAMYYHLQEWDRSDIFERITSRLNDSSAQSDSAELLYREPLEKAWDLAEFLLGQPPSKSKGEPQWSNAKSPGDDPKRYHDLIDALRAAIKKDRIYINDVGKVINYAGF